MYSSHRIDSVTCLRFSSRWITAQSGSTWRRWPCFVPASLYSFASRTASVSCSGSGQLKPAASKRSIVARTVDGASASRAGDLRAEIPAATQTQNLAHMAHRKPSPLASIRSHGTAKEADPTQASRGFPNRPTPGGIIPEWWARIKSERWARSYRNRWAPSSRNRWAACSGISSPGQPRGHRRRTGARQAPSGSAPETMKEASEAVSSLSKAGSPAELAAKEAELGKSAFEKSVATMREMAESWSSPAKRRPIGSTRALPPLSRRSAAWGRRSRRCPRKIASGHPALAAVCSCPVSRPPPRARSPRQRRQGWRWWCDRADAGLSGGEIELKTMVALDDPPGSG